MVAVRRHAPARMTLPEFLVWNPADPSGRTWQLLDGEPIAMAPGSETHAALQAEFARVLGNHLVEQGSPCRVLTDPGIVPRVRANRNYRVPDLAVTCAEPSAHLIVAEPVLLIELISPADEFETWANIWAYTTLPSVRDILAVYTTRIEAELLRRRADGTWPEEAEVIKPGDMVMLDSIGFKAPLARLYRTSALAGR